MDTLAHVAAACSARDLTADCEQNRTKAAPKTFENMTAWTLVGLALLPAAAAKSTDKDRGASCWVDPDTPKTAATTTDSRKDSHHLIFSDEFNEAGREFRAQQRLHSTCISPHNVCVAAACDAVSGGGEPCISATRPSAAHTRRHVHAVTSRVWSRACVSLRTRARVCGSLPWRAPPEPPSQCHPSGNGRDERWTALEIGDTSNKGAAFYLPEQASIATDTVDPDRPVSALLISTEDAPHTGDSPTGEKGITMPYKSAMLQTCTAGGHSSQFSTHVRVQIGERLALASLTSDGGRSLSHARREQVLFHRWDRGVPRAPATRRGLLARSLALRQPRPSGRRRALIALVTRSSCAAARLASRRRLLFTGLPKLEHRAMAVVLRRVRRRPPPRPYLAAAAYLCLHEPGHKVRAESVSGAHSTGHHLNSPASRRAHADQPPSRSFLSPPASRLFACMCPPPPSRAPF